MSAIEELDSCLAALAPAIPRVAIDVGAHYGDWSIGLAQAGARDVHALEPHPDTMAVLKRNVANLPAVRVHEVALSDADAEAVPMFDDAPSTLATIDPRWTETEFAHLFASRKATHAVRAMRWSTFCRQAFLEAVDVLKLDTEGMDCRILADLLATGPLPRVICAEICIGRKETAPVMANLARAGYRHWRTFTLDGRRGFLNMIWVRG